MRIIIVLVAALLTCSPLCSLALIKLDNDSVDLAIKYGIKAKGMTTKDLLGANWVNDPVGRTLNIYSPFIQIAVKASNHGSTGNLEEDVKTVKKVLTNNITKIKTKNEIRFIIDLHGDTPDFAKNYKAHIIDLNKYYKSTDNRDMIKPKKTSIQKVADKDGYDPEHPYSAINCYIFKFDDLFELDEYFFIVTSEKGDQVKYKINNKEIF